MDIDFSGATLYISERSPFARRVRLAFLENGISFEERVVDVYRTNPDFVPVNLLSHVPTLIFRSGEVLNDSTIILALFYATHRSPLMPRDPRTLIRCLEWSSLSIGVMERTVDHFLESLRPEGSRDPEEPAETSALVERFLERLEPELGPRGTLIPDQLSQGDLDLGTALAYLELRYHPEVLGEYPRLTRYLRELESRPSFQRTHPPRS